MYEEKKTIDEVELSFEVRNTYMEELENPPQVGYYIHGFTLEGAR